MKLKQCPCCGSNTISKAGEFEICAKCGWEDDDVQRDDPDFVGGANDMSLNQARDAWRKGKTIE
jgi:hypothetical protein